MNPLTLHRLAVANRFCEEVSDPASPIFGWDLGTGHALAKIDGQKITVDAVIRVLSNPSCTYPSGKYDGQVRYCGEGICLVVNPDQQSVVTIYLDGVVTALRSDQQGAVIR